MGAHFFTGRNDEMKAEVKVENLEFSDFSTILPGAHGLLSRQEGHELLSRYGGSGSWAPDRTTTATRPISNLNPPTAIFGLLNA